MSSLTVTSPAPRKRLAIVTIATGAYYKAFFNDFQESVRANFAPGCDVTIYCFTDTPKPAGSPSEHIETRHLGWPFDTLLRFHLMLSIAEKLMAYDFVLYMDADMKAVGAANPKIFEAPLVAVQHPGFQHKPDLASFEIDETQSTFVGPNARRVYVQGCFWGGEPSAVRSLIDTLTRMIDDDLERGQIPVWHDESYLNWYLAHHHFAIVPPSYAYPETWSLDMKPVLIHRAKNHDVVRGTQMRGVSAAKIIAGLSLQEQVAVYRTLFLAAHIKTQTLEEQLLRRNISLMRSLRSAVMWLFGGPLKRF
jgi:hypothetical protein